jgi:hypothetical protein
MHERGVKREIFHPVFVVANILVANNMHLNIEKKKI